MVSHTWFASSAALGGNVNIRECGTGTNISMYPWCIRPGSTTWYMVPITAAVVLLLYVPGICTAAAVVYLLPVMYGHHPGGEDPQETMIFQFDVLRVRRIRLYSKGCSSENFRYNFRRHEFSCFHLYP